MNPGFFPLVLYPHLRYRQRAWLRSFSRPLNRPSVPSWAPCFRGPVGRAPLRSDRSLRVLVFRVQKRGLVRTLPLLPLSALQQPRCPHAALNTIPDLSVLRPCPERAKLVAATLVPPRLPSARGLLMDRPAPPRILP